MQHLDHNLPDPARAWALCDYYYNIAEWLSVPATQEREAY